MGYLRAVYLARLVQTINVGVQAEDGRPVRGAVTSDALKGAGAVMQSVGCDVHLGFVPRYELAVEPDFVRFLRSFRYPISGEFALTSDLALDVDIPGDWGLEIGIMAEMYRNVTSKRICQTDLGFYDHKHQKVGGDLTGLTKMTGDILKTLLRVLIEEDHIQVSRESLISLRVLYQRHAQDCIRKYNADAHFNNLKYDRHMEETMVEKFSQQILNAGCSYMRKPVGTRIPDWLRTISARRKIREQLLDIVIADNKG